MLENTILFCKFKDIQHYIKIKKNTSNQSRNYMTEYGIHSQALNETMTQTQILDGKTAT